MVIKDPSETWDQGSTNIDNIRTPDNLQLFDPYNISTCIAWQFFLSLFAKIDQENFARQNGR